MAVACIAIRVPFMPTHTIACSSKQCALQKLFLHLSANWSINADQVKFFLWSNRLIGVVKSNIILALFLEMIQNIEKINEDHKNCQPVSLVNETFYIRNFLSLLSCQLLPLFRKISAK